MKFSHDRGAVCTGRPFAVIAVILFALAYTLQAQNKKSSPSPAPRVSAPAPRPATRQAQPARQVVPNNRTTPATNSGGGNVNRPAGRGTGSYPAPLYRGGQPTAVSGRSSVNPGANAINGRTSIGPVTPNGARPGGFLAGSLPHGKVTRNLNGTAAIRTRDGRQYALGNNGQVTGFRGVHNTEARFRPDGSVRMVRAGGMTITHGPTGIRHVAAIKADRTMIVSDGLGRGYVQHPFSVGNRQFVQRTYVVHNLTYTRVYQSYTYHGAMLHTYVPMYYGAPAFYAWAYSPWRAQVRYNWGWYGDPWYGYYGSYFTPYPVYSSPSLWLTDYIVSAALAEAYRERADAVAANTQAAANAQAADMQAGQIAQQSHVNRQDQVALTPAVKQMIADEVLQQLAREKADSQDAAQNLPHDPAAEGISQTLDDSAEHAFVVSSTLEVSAQGQQCTISEGDVLESSGPPQGDSTTVPVKVAASKGQDCEAGIAVTVSLQDLQEMQNHMRETIDQGLQQLQAHRGGLPKPPASAAKDQVQLAFAAAVPPPDPNAGVELTEQEQAAIQAEQQVVKQASDTEGTQSADASLAPVAISRGQTIDDVITNIGTPRRMANLGAKQIYAYDNMKITFENGVVSDVQ